MNRLLLDILLTPYQRTDAMRDPIEGDPWSRPTPCATPDCEHPVTFPDMESLCSECLIAQRNTAHQREQEIERVDKPRLVKATTAPPETLARECERRR